MGGYVAGSNSDIRTLVKPLAERTAAYQATVRGEIHSHFRNFDGQVNAVQMRGILALPSVRGDVTAFVRDVVIGDSGIEFRPDDGAMAALALALGRAATPQNGIPDSDATPTYVEFRNQATGYKEEGSLHAPENPALFSLLERAFVAGQNGQDTVGPAKPDGAR